MDFSRILLEVVSVSKTERRSAGEKWQTKGCAHEAMVGNHANPDGVYPVARNHHNGSGSSELCLVEARGVEPLSEDRRHIASTCVADSLSFATTHAYRQA